MTTPNDDDLLAAYDLSAWDVPPPAPGLVDAVIRRARQPAPVAALDSGERMNPRGKRRWWIAAAAAAVAIAAVLLGVWGVQRSPKNDQGEVIATSARTLAIGPTTAALDPGAQVRWRRDKHRISVAQSRGTAMWNVAADDTLVIDAGAMVATVEASGASLRVEVKLMNASDVRAVGISAATAVAVALVTIVVYEGTVRVRHDGQTVNVVPGAHYEVVPPRAPEPLTVGGGPVDPRIRELEDRIKEIEAERDALKKTVPATDTCDEVSCVLTNYDGACCTRFKAQTPPTQTGLPESIDRAAISEVMQALMPQIKACSVDGYVGMLKIKVKVAPEGTVTEATATAKVIPPATLSSCVEALMRGATFRKTVSGGSFNYPVNFVAPVASCDADALRQKGDDHVQTKMNAAALAAFEKSLQCRPDPDVVRKAYIAACRSKNAPKAKLYFARLPIGEQTSFAQICANEGIQVGLSCDAKALRQKGDDHLATGMDAAALAAFESSMRCQPDPGLFPKAFLAACRSNNAPKSRLYFTKLPAEKQTSLGPICVRLGIDPAPTVTCDAAALAAKGDELLQVGQDAGAFAAFEKSYACKADPMVSRKTYMAACRSKQVAAARKYFALTPVSQRQTLAQICIRQGINVLDADGNATTGSVIKVASMPSAQVFIDGVDTGQITPATLQATPGKHKITLMVGTDKFTYVVNAKEGETVTLTKDLQ